MATLAPPNPLLFLRTVLGAVGWVERMMLSPSHSGSRPVMWAEPAVNDPAFGNPPSMKAALDAQLHRRRIAPPKTLAEYTRLVCDSLGKGHANALAAFERMTGRKFKRILMVGGGSRNRLLCQATADASGLPVVSFKLEGTAVGSIARQLIALGAVKDLPSFRHHLAATLDQKIYAPRG